MTLFRTHQVLSDIAAQQPQSLSHLWDMWLTIRLREEERSSVQKKAALQKEYFSSAPASGIVSVSEGGDRSSNNIINNNNYPKEVSAVSGGGDGNGDIKRVVIEHVNGKDIHAMTDLATSRSRSNTWDYLHAQHRPSLSGGIESSSQATTLFSVRRPI
jgi:hypothetical protein